MKLNEFDFQLHIYPNGRFKHQEDEFIVYLCVNNLGRRTKVSSIFVDWNLFIHEINFSWIVKDRHHSDMSKCRGFSIQNNAQILDPIKQLHERVENPLQSLTFGVLINIKRIFNGTQILNKEIPFQINKHNTLLWNIQSRHILDEMMLSQHQQTHVSELYDNLWYLSITPNGYHEGTQQSFDMFLHLVQLPDEISKLRMKCKFSIPELNIVHNFDADWSNLDKGWGWQANKFSIDILQSNVQHLSIKSYCETVAIFDEDDKLMQLKKDWKYFKINAIEAKNENENIKDSKEMVPPEPKIPAKYRFIPQIFDDKRTEVKNENDQYCLRPNSIGLHFESLDKLLFDVSQDVSIVRQQLFVTIGIFTMNFGVTLFMLSVLISLLCCGCM